MEVCCLCFGDVKVLFNNSSRSAGEGRMMMDKNNSQIYVPYGLVQENIEEAIKFVKTRKDKAYIIADLQSHLRIRGIISPAPHRIILIYCSENERRCRVCGCTWNNPCPGGCYWVEEDLCSQCQDKMD